MERGDYAEMRKPIERHQASDSEGCCLVADSRRAVGHAVPVVELSNALIDLGFNFGIAVKPRTGWYADLDEGHSPPQFRAPRQYCVERSQSLGDAFRVVEPVDADADDVGTKVEELPQALLFIRERLFRSDALNPIV